MNLFLGSIVLLLLLLPAIIFRAFIIKSDGLENPLDTSIKTEISIILIVAIIFHSLGICFLSYCIDLKINYHKIYLVIIGSSNESLENSFNNNIKYFIQYTLAQIIICGISSLLLKKFILRNFLDIRYNILPISNEWDNLLSGRIFRYEIIKFINCRIQDLKVHRKETIKKINQKKLPDRSSVKKNIKKLYKKQILELETEKKNGFSSVEIDALVHTSLGDVIYKGRLYRYFLSKDNSLDKIVLEEAVRRKFCDGNIKKKGKFHLFESKLFTIKYSEIKNLNIRYININKI